MELPKVTIQIVTWNSRRYLPECLAAIFNQTYRNFQVLIVDNNSQDDTVDFVRKNYPEVSVFSNNKNFGFARANNQGIRLLNSPYVLFCNPDIVLEVDFLEKLMAAIERAPDEYGSFGGKLLRLKIVDLENGEFEKTSLIDSCGLKILSNRRVVEIGAGQLTDHFMGQQEVFGQSAALALYKRSVLEDLLVKTKNRPQGEYFDEDFVIYKEDVDLAWRAQLFGWKSLLVADAVAYHVRSMSGSENSSWRDIIRNRRRQSTWARRLSYRNHLFVVFKNDFWQNIGRSFFSILFYELKKFFYLLIFEWSTLPAIFGFFGLLPKIFAKRRVIFRRAKVSAEYMASWIGK